MKFNPMEMSTHTNTCNNAHVARNAWGSISHIVANTHVGPPKFNLSNQKGPLRQWMLPAGVIHSIIMKLGVFTLNVHSDPDSMNAHTVQGSHT